MSGLLLARRRTVAVGAQGGGGGGEGDGDATIVHTLDFETGDLSQVAGVSPSGGGDWGVRTAPNPVHGGTYSCYATLQNSSAGDGIRFRIDNNLDGSQSAEFGGAGWNLPKDAYYSIWVYIPNHIALTGDSWNIFQFKQQIMTGPSSGTMKLIDSLTLKDRGAGNPYGVRIVSIIHDDGSWTHTNKPTWHYDQPLIPVGQWVHIEWHRIISTDPAVGRNTIRVNEQVFHDVTRQTQAEGTHEGNNFDDFNPNRHFQWTYNSYHTGGSGTNHDPNTHTLYFDDGYVAMGGWVGMDGP